MNLTSVFKFKNLRKIFAIEFLSVLILALATLVPTWLYIVKSSTDNELFAITKIVKIAVFLKIDSDKTSAEKIINQIKQFSEIKDVEYVSQKQAMQIFKNQTDLKNDLSFLKKDVLPQTLFVELKNINKLASLDNVILKIKKIPKVDLVVLDSYWVDKLKTLFSLLEKLFIFTSWSFVFMFMVIVFFVTKVLLSEVLNEIKLRLLLGSTHIKIIIRYVLKSFYLGAISGFLCLFLTFLGILWLSNPLEKFIKNFGIDLNINMLNFVDSSLLIVISALLYSITAWITCAFILLQMDKNLQQTDKF